LEKDLEWIAKRVTHANRLYLSLDLSQADWETLRRDNPDDHLSVKTNMMLLWRKNMGNYATLKTLVTVLVEDKLDVNLAEEIIKYFKGKCKYYYTFVVTCNGSVQCWVYSIFETIY